LRTTFVEVVTAISNAPRACNAASADEEQEEDDGRQEAASRVSSSCYQADDRKEEESHMSAKHDPGTIILKPTREKKLRMKRTPRKKI
jgi:hypothetical protein